MKGKETMRLERASREMYHQIYKLYMEAFPAEERAPFRHLIHRAELGKADLWNLYEEKQWTGFLYVLSLKKVAYIFYLAIDSAQRGKGFGTAAIEAMKQRYKGYRIFVSLENPNEIADNAPQRIERYMFYKRCGFEDLPCRVREGTVVFALMGIGECIQPEEYRELIDHSLGKMYRHIFCLKIVE